MKKNLMAWPIFLKIVSPVIGFFLSAKNAFKIADRAKKCAWYLFYLLKSILLWATRTVSVFKVVHLWGLKCLATCFCFYRAHLLVPPAILDAFFAVKKTPIPGPTIFKQMGPAMRFFFMKHMCFRHFSSKTSLPAEFWDSGTLWKF